MNTRRIEMNPGILTMCVVLIFSTVVFAHGNEQHVMGTVTTIDKDSISVSTQAGETKTVMVTPTTKYMRGQATATQKDLKVGDRVVIHAAPMGNMLRATEVKIGGAAAPAGQH
jgi:Domain of unknown function (DUF5666)